MPIRRRELEYGDHIGDGGFILKFGDGTVTKREMESKKFLHGPLGSDVKNPKVKHEPIPDNWWAVDFDDSKWGYATGIYRRTCEPKRTVL
jgi:hypothetical protein